MNDHFQPDGKLHPCDLAPDLFTARLDNGLKIIIRQDARTPVAVCNVWVRVGSNREPEPMRGWSHGIEHMLFKGTEHRDEGDFAKEVADAGGTTNAGTGYETTNYHITVPAENLDVAIDILGDALLNSRFDAASLDAERQVLVHENHMYDDIPFGFGVTWRWGMELAFDVSPYQHPIGGRDENLLERDRDDIIAFYRSAYRPDNMTVVIVGDVDPDSVCELVASRFASLGSLHADLDPGTDTAIVAAPAVEPAHHGTRLRVEQGDIQKAYAKLILPGPPENDPDRPVLSVVRRVLSDGRSCRLYRQVQEELKLVDDFTVMTEAGPREGVFIIDIETTPERIVPALQAITTILGDLQRAGCSETELDRARVRVARGFLFGEETVQGQASTLGYHEAIDDLPGAFELPQRVAAVRIEDVKRLSHRLFDTDKLSCLIYLPAESDPVAAGIPANGEELAALLGPTLEPEAPDTAGGGAASDALPPASGEPSAPLVRRRETDGGLEFVFRESRLANGVVVCARRDPAVPVMAMTLTTRGGANGESADNAGLAALTQMVQVKGAGGLDAEALHEVLEGEGASVGPRADRDYSGLFLSGLTERMDRVLDLTGQMVTEPAFAPLEVEQERRLALEQLAAMQDNPFQAAAVELRRLVYGDHPYGRPLPGTTRSLPALTRDQVVACHRRMWTADNLQVVVSGDFDEDRLLAKLETILQDLPASPPDDAPAAPPPGPTRVPADVEGLRIERDQNQSVVLVAWPGPQTPDTDRFALMMLKEVLNGQSGRLFESLRNQRSLCYNTGSMSTAGYGQGMFMGYVLTSPERAKEARDALVTELTRVPNALLEAEEFERARAKLVGNLLIASQANSGRVGRASRDMIYGRGPNDLPRLVEGIRTCTAAEVQTVAARYLDPDRYFEVILGP